MGSEGGQGLAGWPLCGHRSPVTVVVLLCVSLPQHDMTAEFIAQELGLTEVSTLLKGN